MPPSGVEPREIAPMPKVKVSFPPYSLLHGMTTSTRDACTCWSREFARPGKVMSLNVSAQLGLSSFGRAAGAVAALVSHPHV